MPCRTATHANSWYTGDGAVLDRQLNAWLDAVPSELENVGKVPVEGARIIIAPKRVFILGPSHHVYLDGCALSPCDTYATPLGNLTLDKEAIQELYASGKFSYMDLQTDEDEHSIEMHLPYVYKVLERTKKLPDTKIVPILVGALKPQKEKAFGELLAPWLRDPENAFVISSDFCHWGLRFSYTNYYPSIPTAGAPSPPLQVLNSRSSRPSDPEIYQSIEAIDKEGVLAIETGSHDAFIDYLKRTKNTICGRHPIAVIMAGIEKVLSEESEEGKGRFKFVRYEQSSQCKEVRDSSVSYASAFAVI
ncbi:hypothetical protein RUND412_011056 [Rhizina undulata]